MLPDTGSENDDLDNCTSPAQDVQPERRQLRNPRLGVLLLEHGQRGILCRRCQPPYSLDVKVKLALSPSTCRWYMTHMVGNAKNQSGARILPSERASEGPGGRLR